MAITGYILTRAYRSGNAGDPSHIVQMADTAGGNVIIGEIANRTVAERIRDFLNAGLNE